jgi:HEAT repeat protein
MKTSTIKSALRNTFLAVMAVTIIAGSVQAQNENQLTGVKRERAIKSLVFNITHAEASVRDVSIKYAGEYKLAETTDALIELLKKNDEAKTKILIANSLFMIGDEKGINAIRTVASEEKDQSVKEVYAKFINEYDSAKKY